MKFAHIADCHIGSWREPKLRDASITAFIKAIDMCVAGSVDFILISGDLFNTSLPAVDHLKEVVERLKMLKDREIPVYVVAGSHDFSASGKTMLEVLEKAGLFVNVSGHEMVGDMIKLNFVADKAGANITGMIGKKGGLEREFYKKLIKENLEAEGGYKIFMFHSAIEEFKPADLAEMDAAPLSFLPKGFDYYAGGHVHYVFKKEEPGYGMIAFPGPCFPNNFRELEKLGRGGFYIVEVADGKTSVEYEPIQVHNVFRILVNAEGKSPEQVEQDILGQIKGKEFNNTIVTIRVEGKLSTGKPSDVNFKEIFDALYNKSAYFVMKNANKLIGREFEEIKVEQESQEKIEDALIKEHIGQIKCFDAVKEEHLTKALIKALDTEKQEGERVAEFEKRVIEQLQSILLQS
jgi:exonuclease SbcD